MIQDTSMWTAMDRMRSTPPILLSAHRQMHKDMTTPRPAAAREHTQDEYLHYWILLPTQPAPGVQLCVQYIAMIISLPSTILPSCFLTLRRVSESQRTTSFILISIMEIIWVS